MYIFKENWVRFKGKWQQQIIIANITVAAFPNSKLAVYQRHFCSSSFSSSHRQINENEPTNVCYRGKKSHSPNPPKNAFKCPPIVVSLSTAAARAAMAISFPPFSSDNRVLPFSGQKTRRQYYTHSGKRIWRPTEEKREKTLSKKNLLSLLAKLERDDFCCVAYTAAIIEWGCRSNLLLSLEGFFFGEKECCTF